VAPKTALFQIPPARLLALHLQHDSTGVFRSQFVSESPVGPFSPWLFSRGGWNDVKF
jgi:hypothetical protein